jgi:hypothetical protein
MRSYSRAMAKQALAAVMLCLVVAACGGRERRTQPLSRGAFTASANAVCTAARTGAERVQRLRRLRPPAAFADLYAQWLRAEADAVAAAKAVAGQSKWTGVDPHVALAIAQGEAVGYARRLGAEACTSRAAGRMPA